MEGLSCLFGFLPHLNGLSNLFILLDGIFSRFNDRLLNEFAAEVQVIWDDFINNLLNLGLIVNGLLQQYLHVPIHASLEGLSAGDLGKRPRHVFDHVEATLLQFERVWLKGKIFHDKLLCGDFSNFDSPIDNRLNNLLNGKINCLSYKHFEIEIKRLVLG